MGIGKCEMLLDSMLPEIKGFTTTWNCGNKGMREVSVVTYQAANPFKVCVAPAISKMAERTEDPTDRRLKWFRHMVRDTTTTRTTWAGATLCLVLVIWVHNHLDKHHLPLSPAVSALLVPSIHPKLCLPLPG
jgi:hypothetical protein